MWEYSERTLEHFPHPRNVGGVENPDGTALVGNIACGDALKLTWGSSSPGLLFALSLPGNTSHPTFISCQSRVEWGNLTPTPSQNRT